VLLTDVAGQWALLQSERALVPSVHSMIAINGALVLFCVFYSTKNIVLAPVACGSIVILLFTTTAWMGMTGIKVDMLSVQFLVLASGFSFNYVTLLSHFYAVSPFTTRSARITHALFEIGPLIIASFLTLTPAAMLLLLFESGTMNRLGVMMSVTCIGNLVIAFLFFPSVLMVCGPAGSQGDVPWFSVTKMARNSATFKALQSLVTECQERISQIFNRFDPIFGDHNYPMSYEAIRRGEDRGSARQQSTRDAQSENVRKDQDEKTGERKKRRKKRRVGKK
jgi:hypothetical protein